MVAQPNRLKELRDAVNLTQEEVAKVIGIDATTVSKHENGDRALSDIMIKAYARLYKKETHELFMNLGAEGDVVIDK